MNLKEHKKRLSSEERRAHILDVALGLFANKGFSGTKTREIAEAAGVSETLIFKHFKTKKDLYEAALNQLHDQHPLKPEVEQLMTNKDDFGVFKTIALHILRHGREDNRAIRLSIFNALEGLHMSDILKRQEGPALSEIKFLEQYIQQRINEGAFKKLNAQLVARLFTEAVDMYLVAEEALMNGAPHSYSDEEVADTMVKIIIYGINAQLPVR